MKHMVMRILLHLDQKQIFIIKNNPLRIIDFREFVFSLGNSALLGIEVLMTHDFFYN